MNLQKLGLVVAMGLATNLSFAHGEHGNNTVWKDTASQFCLLMVNAYVLSTLTS